MLEKISQLSDDKITHRKDPYKKDNDGSFLYFEVLKHRIVYQVQGKEVFIVRIRHTKMEPLKY